MSIWDKLFGKKSAGGKGDDPMAWLRRQVEDLDPPSHPRSVAPHVLQKQLDRLCDGKITLVAVRNSGTMLWGLALTREQMDQARVEIEPRIDVALKRWEEMLGATFGEPGRSFFAEVAEQRRLTLGTGKPRRGRHRYSLDPPRAPGPYEDARLDEAIEHGGLVVEREGDRIVRARIAIVEGGDHDSESVLEALLARPDAARIRDLTLGLCGVPDEGFGEYAGVLGVLEQNRAACAEIERIFIGDFEYPDEVEISWTHVGNLGPLLAATPALKSLRVRGGGVAIEPASHDRLESLVIETGGLPKEAVVSIASGRFPALHTLEVWFGDPNYGGDGDAASFRPFFEHGGYPRLVHLGLRNCGFTDDLVEALCATGDPGYRASAAIPLPPRLVSLDLSKGTLTSRGALRLIAAKDRFPALERLDVDDCFLDESSQRALQLAFGARVKIGTQRDADEYDGEYYVSVGE